MSAERSAFDNLLVIHHGPAELCNKRFRLLTRAVGDLHMADTFAYQVFQRQLAGFPCPDKKGGLPGKVLEDLACQFYRRIADRYGPFADGGLGPGAFAHVQRRLHQAVHHRAQGIRFPRKRESFLHLVQNLDVADHQRIDPGGHLEEMGDGISRRSSDEMLLSHHVRGVLEIDEELPHRGIIGRLRLVVMPYSSVRLQVETSTHSEKKLSFRRRTASRTSSAENHIFSRMSTEAVWWLMPMERRFIEAECTNGSYGTRSSTD